MNVYLHVRLNAQSRAYLQSKMPLGTTLFEGSGGDSEREKYKKFEACNFAFGNIPHQWLSSEMRLKWLQLESVGFESYQHLDIGIPISNMQGFFAQPCAETVVAGIMALYRKLHDLVVLKEQKSWQTGSVRPTLELLRGKSVIILGTGSIALAIKEILAAFKCSVLFYGRKPPEATIHDKEKLMSFLSETDVLINTLPGTNETRKFVCHRVLESMKPQALFVNIGRGTTVDETALIESLKEYRIAGAVLDVSESEPLAAQHPLWDCPNTILTQHTGGGFILEEQGKVDLFINNLEKILKNEAPDNIIELKKGY